MKAYVMTTGTSFGLLAGAHIWRVFAEGLNLAKDLAYILITLAAAAMFSDSGSAIAFDVRSRQLTLALTRVKAAC